MKVTHLFLDFLKSKTEYERSVEFWRNLCEEVINPPERGNWTEWLNTRFADGTPFLDGNPIYSSWCSGRKRAFKIIQHAPLSDALVISAWMDTFGGDTPDSPEYLQEMIIACELSEESAEIAKTLIAAWGGDVSFEEMSAIIRRSIPTP